MRGEGEAGTLLAREYDRDRPVLLNKCKCVELHIIHLSFSVPSFGSESFKRERARGISLFSYERMRRTASAICATVRRKPHRRDGPLYNCVASRGVNCGCGNE